MKKAASIFSLFCGVSMFVVWGIIEYFDSEQGNQWIKKIRTSDQAIEYRLVLSQVLC